MQPDTFARTVSLALFLFDGFTGRNRLIGLYDDEAAEREDQRLADLGDGDRLARHTTVRIAGRSIVPFRKAPDAAWVLLGLPAGIYTMTIRGPYYGSRDISVALPAPDPKWPAFPDVTQADESLPLDAPTQPPAYRTQRAQATLQPTPRYPFPGGATLVRGTVRSANQPLENARVRRTGQTIEYVTDKSGEYVLFFLDLVGASQTVSIEALHPLHVTVSTNVTCVRGMTVQQDIVMA
jgi:hypothetical protein